MKRSRVTALIAVFFVILIMTGCRDNSGGEPVPEDPVVENPVEEEPEVIEVPGEEPVAVDEPEVVDEPGDPEENEVPETQEADKVYVSITGLNFREGPGSDTRILRVLDYKETLELTRNQEEKWLEVKDETGTVGWVFSDYVGSEVTTTITRVYHDVDYSAYEKPVDFENNPPVAVKGIYVSGHSAAGNLDYYINLIKASELNALIIDVKDDNGNLLFPSEAAGSLFGENYKVHIKEIQPVMERLKEEGIYLIARIVAFKSPRYAALYPDRAISYKQGGTYKDNNGIYWASPYDRELWNYLIAVSKEAAEAGFNEIQYDYVRFPTSGGANLDSLLDYKNPSGETKTKAVQDFIKTAQEKLEDSDVYISADVYGWTATAVNDVGIGQHWEAISNVVDVISPMSYPSHYGTGNFGFEVPDAHPYEVLREATKDAIQRNQNIETPALIRPWIQNFTATWVKGHISYGMREVNLQIQAMKELGVDEYMLWNSRNVYNVEGLGVE